MNWTAAELKTLIDNYGKLPASKIARMLGRSRLSVKSRVHLLKLKVGHPYAFKPVEIETARRMHGTHTAGQIAAVIGRPTHSIYQLFERLGLRKFPRIAAEVIEQVRQLHAEGLNDGEIARRLPGVNRRSIRDIRARRLGLPVNVEAVKRGGRNAVKQQLKTLGLKAPAELRARAYKNYARENGFPEDLPPRCVQTLNVLAERGPMTLQELTVVMGFIATGGRQGTPQAVVVVQQNQNAPEYQEPIGDAVLVHNPCERCELTECKPHSKYCAGCIEAMKAGAHFALTEAQRRRDGGLSA